MITVALIDDHGLVVAIADWLEKAHDIDVVATAASVAELVAALPEPPDVVVLDVWLQDDSDFRRNVERLHAWGTRIVVMTSDAGGSGLRVTAFQENIAAFLVKRAELDGLLAAVRRAVDGEQQMTDEWAAHLGTPPIRLTVTETKVIRLYAAGMTYAEIANKLGVHHQTAKGHVDRVRAKYRAADRPSVTRADLTGEIRRDGHLPGPA